ncbi:MAG: Stress responsive Barrel Domain [Actinomycetota bacterium]|jgi:hypothetical protein
MTTAHSSGPIRHVVNIRLEPELDDTLRLPLETDLHALVEAHPHALSARLQRDLGRRPHSPICATWMVVMDFASMTDFESYLAHPLHVDFLSTHQPSMAFITAIQVPLDEAHS